MGRRRRTEDFQVRDGRVTKWPSFTSTRPTQRARSNSPGTAASFIAASRRSTSGVTETFECSCSSQVGAGGRHRLMLANQPMKESLQLSRKSGRRASLSKSTTSSWTICGSGWKISPVEHTESAPLAERRGRSRGRTRGRRRHLPLIDLRNYASLCRHSSTPCLGVGRGRCQARIQQLQGLEVAIMPTHAGPIGPVGPQGPTGPNPPGPARPRPGEAEDDVLDVGPDEPGGPDPEFAEPPGRPSPTPNDFLLHRGTRTPQVSATQFFRQAAAEGPGPWSADGPATSFHLYRRPLRRQGQDASPLDFESWGDVPDGPLTRELKHFPEEGHLDLPESEGGPGGNPATRPPTGPTGPESALGGPGLSRAAPRGPAAVVPGAVTAGQAIRPQTAAETAWVQRMAAGLVCPRCGFTAASAAPRQDHDGRLAGDICPACQSALLGPKAVAETSLIQQRTPTAQVTSRSF